MYNCTLWLSLHFIKTSWDQWWKVKVLLVVTERAVVVVTQIHFTLCLNAPIVVETTVELDTLIWSVKLKEHSNAQWLHSHTGSTCYMGYFIRIVCASERVTLDDVLTQTKQIFWISCTLSLSAHSASPKLKLIHLNLYLFVCSYLQWRPVYIWRI